VLGFSDTYISRDLTRLDSRAESRVIPFGLIAISFGEIGDHTIETLASTQIRRDLYTIAGAGVRSGQRPAAYARICPHKGQVGRTTCALSSPTADRSLAGASSSIHSGTPECFSCMRLASTDPNPSFWATSSSEQLLSSRRTARIPKVSRAWRRSGPDAGCGKLFMG
jgi:hypothetical protein